MFRFDELLKLHENFFSYIIHCVILSGVVVFFRAVTSTSE